MKKRIGFLYRRGVIWFALDIEWCLMNFVLPQIDSFDFKWFLSHVFNNSLKSTFVWNLHSFRICAHMKSSTYCFTSNEFILLQMITFSNKGYFWQLKKRIGFLYRQGVKYFSLDIKWCLINFVLPQMDSFNFKWYLSQII